MQTHIEITLIGPSETLKGIEQYLMVKYDKPARREAMKGGLKLLFEDVGLEMIRDIAATAYAHERFQSFNILNDPKALSY